MLANIFSCYIILRAVIVCIVGANFVLLSFTLYMLVVACICHWERTAFNKCDRRVIYFDVAQRLKLAFALRKFVSVHFQLLTISLGRRRIQAFGRRKTSYLKADRSSNLLMQLRLWSVYDFSHRTTLVASCFGVEIWFVAVAAENSVGNSFIAFGWLCCWDTATHDAVTQSLPTRSECSLLALWFFICMSQA